MPGGISDLFGNMFTAEKFLDLSHCEHAEFLFVDGESVWSAIPRIAAYLDAKEGYSHDGDVSDRAHIGERVHIGEGTTVEPGAFIEGPTWIGKNCVVRAGAYIRGNVIAGDNCTLGNSSEFKNCLLFDKVETPHFNYVGDSILGYKAHLGAGVILSNVRLDRQQVLVRDIDGEKHATDLRKFGAIIGDRTEVGCNSVISPGSLLGRDCIVHPCTHWSGQLADRRLVKNRQTLEVVEVVERES
jgi:NDP-sugar pyrophosphorylase family protein